MFGYFKGAPTEYIFRYNGGKLVSQGQGISFYYLTINTNVVAVPTSSVDAGFVFNETSANFQNVAIQGQFAYRVQDPQKTAALLNFAIKPGSHEYLTNDHEKLPQRVANVIQMHARSLIQSRTLEESLQSSEEIATAVLQGVSSSAVLQSLGVELLSLFFLTIKPTPEVGKALEATYREALLRRADEAIYARRASGVEEEQKIKQNELNSDTALAEQRKQLIALDGANNEAAAQHRGKAFEEESSYRMRVLETELKMYQEVPAKTLLAAAIKALGDNAAKIGNLTVTSEILSSLLNGSESEKSSR
jgi:regulator of protease activity HflC (stomatin/prohibitin superfamily)